MSRYLQTLNTGRTHSFLEKRLFVCWRIQKCNTVGTNFRDKDPLSALMQEYRHRQRIHCILINNTAQPGNPCAFVSHLNATSALPRSAAADKFASRRSVSQMISTPLVTQPSWTLKITDIFKSGTLEVLAVSILERASRTAYGRVRGTNLCGNPFKPVSRVTFCQLLCAQTKQRGPILSETCVPTEWDKYNQEGIIKLLGIYRLCWHTPRDSVAF